METIHRTQTNFRKILHSMSYPGELTTLTAPDHYAKLFDKDASLPVPAAYAVLEVVLDGEVHFMTYPQTPIFEQELRMYTNAKLTSEASQADYLYVATQDLDTPDTKRILSQVKTGDLEDPQLSTTLIMQVDNLQAGPVNASLSGPGIKETRQVYLPLSQDFLHWRQVTNQEFPLGVDLILVDANNQCLALPRTSHIVCQKGGQ